MSSGWTLKDLEDRGLKEQPDGTYRKENKVPIKRKIEDRGDKDKRSDEPIFIRYNVPSSKNSKQLYRNKNTGKQFVTESDLCKSYRKVTNLSWTVFKKKFIRLLEGKKKPFKIGLFFVRDSKRRFDYHNICQIVLDLMVEHNWIDDDNMDEIIPVFEGYEVDKENPGVKIRVL